MNVAELQQRVAETARAAGSDPPFPQLDLQRVLPQLHLHCVVEPRPVWAPRTAYERVWARINGLVRRVAAHVVEPALAQQNESNAAVLAALEHLIAADAALRAAISVACMHSNEEQANTPNNRTCDPSQ
jgi:hypothetical protein